MSSSRGEGYIKKINNRGKKSGQKMMRLWTKLLLVERRLDMKGGIKWTDNEVLLRYGSKKEKKTDPILDKVQKYKV